MDGLSLSEVLAPFYEEGPSDNPRAKVEEILRKYRNSPDDDGLSCPIISVEALTPEDRASIDSCLETMWSQMSGEAATLEHTGNASSPSMPLPPTAPMAQDILSFHIAKNTLQALTSHSPEKTRTRPTHFDLTQLLLSRVTIRKYNGDFYFFNGFVYQFLPSADLHTFIYSAIPDAIQQDGSPRALANVASFLSAHPLIRVASTTDSPSRLYFLNGALEVSKNQLRPVGPQDFFTSYIAVNFPVGNSPPCPIFDKFLNEISGGDITVSQTILEMMGYLIMPGNDAKAFFVLLGVGNSGKSVLGNLIADLFNPEAVSHLDIFRLGGRFDLSALRRVRVNISMDLANGCLNRQAISAIKCITGDDGIPLEGKFKDVEFGKVQCKLLFGSNHRLSLAENDEALLNRLVVIPFRHAIPKEQQDKGLLAKLRQEKSAIVVRALGAYKTLVARNFQFLLGAGELGRSVCGYTDSSDIIEQFLTERCVFDSAAITPTSLLHQAFCQFCDERRLPTIPNCATFSRRLSNFCCGRIENQKKRIGGVSTNCYVGIRTIM